MNPPEENGDIMCDGVYGQEPWVYSNVVRDHFFHPRNTLLDEKEYFADGVGMSGNMACGDLMKVYIKVDSTGNKIIDCKWRTFGCASAIAATSMMSIMVTENGGMSLKKAERIKPQQLIERLHGLPDRKFHCSVLGLDALKGAIKNYKSKKQEI